MAIAAFGFAKPAEAVSPMSVVFYPNPLFSDSNFMPGDFKEASATITNNTDANQDAYIEAVSVIDDDNLASQMNIEIFENSSSIFHGNFASFLTAGPVSLSSISEGGSKKYDLKISFIEGSDNDYQGKTLSFDICVGFSGGNQTCTKETAVSEESGTDGSGGGGGAGSRHLIIYAERATDVGSSGAIPESGTATIIWITNKPATSQVIYGLSGASYTLDENNPPNYGYPFSTEEDMAKVINHVVVLSGLNPGETYVYRVVSKASPPTISYEHEFTVPLEPGRLTQSGGVGLNVGGEENGGEDGQAKGGTMEGLVSKVIKTFDSNNLASVFGTGWNFITGNWLWILILLLVIAFFLWRLSKRNNQN